MRALNRAKSDKKIKGLFIRANGWGMSPAQAEELSLAINDFKTSGKFVIAHAQGFEGTSLSGYMAVSGADEIWMQKTTGVAMSGYRAEIEFLGGVFEKFPKLRVAFTETGTMWVIPTYLQLLEHHYHDTQFSMKLGDFRSHLSLWVKPCPKTCAHKHRENQTFCPYGNLVPGVQAEIFSIPRSWVCYE